MKNVIPTFALMPNRNTNVDLTTVSPTIADTMLCTGVLIVILKIVKVNTIV